MLMTRKNLFFDGAAGVGGGGAADTEQYQAGYDAAAGAAENPAEVEDGAEIVEGDAGEGDPDAGSAGGTTAEASAPSERDHLMALLQERFNAAKAAGKKAMTEDAGAGVKEATHTVIEVLKETFAPADRFKKEAPQDSQSRQKNALFLKLQNDATLWLKTFRAQISDKSKKPTTQPTFKQLLQDVTKDINESLRRKAGDEQKKQGDILRDVGNEFSKLTQIKKDAKDLNAEKESGDVAAKPEDAPEELTPEERRQFADDLPDDHFGVGGENGLTGRECAQAKPVKAILAEEDKKAFAESKDAAKVETAKDADVAQASTETQAANTGKTARPDQTGMRATVLALKEGGKLSKEAADDLLKRLAEQGVAAMKSGAMCLAAKDEEEQYEFCFNGLYENAMGVLGLSGGEGKSEAGDGVESTSSKTGFRNAVCGLSKALEKGMQREFAKKIAATKEISAQRTYDGETPEAGQLEYNQLIATGESVFVPDAALPVGYVSHQKFVRDQVEKNGDLLIGWAQAADPDAVV